CVAIPWANSILCNVQGIRTGIKKSPCVVFNKGDSLLLRAASDGVILPTEKHHQGISDLTFQEETRRVLFRQRHSRLEGHRPRHHPQKRFHRRVQQRSERSQAGSESLEPPPPDR